MGKSKALLLTGEIIGTIASVFWIVVLVLSAFTESEPVTWEGVLLFLLVAGASTGIAISYRRLRMGTHVVLTFAFLLGIFAIASAGHNHWLAVLISAGPFIVAGVLFLLSKD